MLPMIKLSALLFPYSLTGYNDIRITKRLENTYKHGGTQNNKCDAQYILVCQLIDKISQQLTPMGPSFIKIISSSASFAYAKQV